MMACENNAHVSKFISVAGAATSADAILKKVLIMQLAGQSDDFKNQAFSYIDQLKEGKRPENIPPIHYSLLRSSVHPFLISWFKYDPLAQIAKLKIPILILQGDMDVLISEKDAELLHKAAPGSEKMIIKGMNYMLKNSQSTDINRQLVDSYNNPNTPINEELVEKIVGFVSLCTE
jgi:pimeloyl-ACP methyl ester carboxylesterase